MLGLSVIEMSPIEGANEQESTDEVKVVESDLDEFIQTEQNVELQIEENRKVKLLFIILKFL